MICVPIPSMHPAGRQAGAFGGFPICAAAHWSEPDSLPPARRRPAGPIGEPLGLTSLRPIETMNGQLIYLMILAGRSGCSRPPPEGAGRPDRKEAEWGESRALEANGNGGGAV